jgi:hypothetical protein
MKAYCEAVIQAESKPKRWGSSDAECIHSKSPQKPPFSQEITQEVNAQERETEISCRHSVGSETDVHSVEDILLRSRHSVGSETDIPQEGKQQAQERDGQKDR